MPKSIFQSFSMVKGFTQTRMRAQGSATPDSELHASAAKRSLKRDQASKAPIPDDDAKLLDEYGSPQTPSKKKLKAMVHSTSFEITKELRAKVRDSDPSIFKLRSLRHMRCFSSYLNSHHFHISISLHNRQTGISTITICHHDAVRCKD